MRIPDWASKTPWSAICLSSPSLSADKGKKMIDNKINNLLINARNRGSWWIGGKNRNQKKNTEVFFWINCSNLPLQQIHTFENWLSSPIQATRFNSNSLASGFKTTFTCLFCSTLQRHSWSLREKARERERKRERERERERKQERERERETERQRDRETERQRDRERQREKGKECMKWFQKIKIDLKKKSVRPG